MLQVVAGRRAAAALAVLACLLCHSPAGAQSAAPPEPSAPPPDPVEPSPLDPSAPLDPWPDLGLPWPDLEEDRGAEIPVTPDGNVAEAGTIRTYNYRIEGIGLEVSPGVLTQFRALSTLEEYRRDPANAAQVARRARADSELLAELLRAFGHFDALVTSEVESDSAGAMIVILNAETGPLFRFSDVSLPGLEAATGEDAPALRQSFGIAPDDPVNADAVNQALASLRVALGRRGYAFAEVGEPEIVVDHETQRATLRLPVRPEGTRRFGRVVVEGRPLFDAGHIETIARFDEGDPYRVDRIEDLRQALVATGLVSSVVIRPVARPETDLVDLAVQLEPAPMRTIAGEAGYGTGEGVRAEISWQHRNLLPPEGAVTFRGVLGTREQLASAVLRRNNFRRRDQVLNAQAAVLHVDRPAFDARGLVLTAGIERQSNIIWQKKWTWSVSTELSASDERDVDLATGTTRRRTFFIAALPAFLGYDGSNDLLDPTNGFRLSARVSPEVSFQSGTFGYARVQLDGSFYFPASDRVTIAGRTRLGTIFGADRDQIAPSRRFYAGGGGSVRGYGFQRIGPRDPVFDDPIGGRSLTEFAIEARVRFGDFGVVPFFDGGNISTSPLPQFDNLRFGAGIGLRYHTRFGPIRVDVATPINPTSSDPRIAVYVSLGQAF